MRLAAEFFLYPSASGKRKAESGKRKEERGGVWAFGFTLVMLCGGMLWVLWTLRGERWVAVSLIGASGGLGWGVGFFL